MPESPTPAPLAVAAPPGGMIGQARAYAALALPMVVSRLGVAAFGIVDGVMLARHSTQQLAVHGLAEPLMGRVMEVAMIVGTAGLGLAAQARAAGPAHAREVGAIWHNALVLSLLLGIAGLLIGLLGGPLLRALGQPPELIDAAGLVLVILGWSIAPALFGMVCGGMLEALGRPLGVAVAVVVANALNVALNQWFIFGGAGVPALGAVGAAWSTLLVRVGLAVALLALMWWLRGHEGYALRGRFGLAQWRSGAEQRRRGWAGAANVGVLALLSLGLPVMAGWLGAFAVAQITALFLALAPAMVIAWGLGDAAGLRIAALLGQGRGAALLESGRQLATLLMLVLAAAVAAFTLSPRSLLTLAVRDAALVDSLVPLVPLGLLALVGDAVSVFYAAMLRSLGVLRGPFIAHLVSGLAMLALAVGLGFGLAWGLAGLLAAHGTAALARAVALAWMYERHAAEHDRRATSPSGAR